MLEGGALQAVNFDPAHRPKRQDWTGDLVENGAFYFTRLHLLRRGLIQGGKVGYVEMSEAKSLDIDTPYDLWLARQQIIYYSTQQPDASSSPHKEKQ